MSQSGPNGRATVYVCLTCRPPTATPDGPCSGAMLAKATVAAAVNAAVPGVSVQRVKCLGNCSRGPSAAIKCEGAWSYIFGGLNPEQDGPALIAGAQLLAGAADGFMPWRGRPDCLKRGLIARLPPTDFLEEPT